MKQIYVLFILISIFIVSCSYPRDCVIEGKTKMIIYKIRKTDNKDGIYQYAINDATNKGWTLYSNNLYTIGDTIYISNKQNAKN